MGKITRQELAESLLSKIGEGGGGDSKSGIVFITDITPQNVNSNVSSKVYSSGIVLESCATNTENIRVELIAMSGYSNYIPVIRVNGNIVSNLTETGKFTFSGTIDIALDFNNISPLIIEHEDGANRSVIITQDSIPEIISATFTGGYPGTQTELKENDNYDLNIVSDIEIVEVQLHNFGAFKSSTHSVSGTNASITGTIADRGNNPQLLGCTVRVRTSTGSWSNWYDSSSAGMVDGLNVVNLNNRRPSINIGSIAYPIGQQAIKNNESVQVANTVSDFDSIIYSSPNGQLSINNVDNYESSKTANRIDGNYNVSTSNFRITATRNANNSQTVSNTIVFIANSAPTITVSTHTQRLRSGGNDGTSAQNHVIRIIANQRLIQAPSLNAPVGVWLGAGFSGSNTEWTRFLQIHDNMFKGTHDFDTLNAVNLAGIVQTVITNGQSYTLGGFVSRVVTLEPFANEAIINVEAVDYNKVTFAWSFNSNVTSREALNSQPVITGGWCLAALNVKPTIVRILDDSYAASSAPSTITIQEVV